MKKILILVLAFTMCFGMTGCGDGKTGNKSNTPSNIVISSGNSGGTYYYIAAGQSKILTEKIEGLSVTTESTTGSPVENGTFTSNSLDTMGIVTLDGLSAGLAGDKDKGFQKPLENLRMVQAGHKLILYFVTLQNSGVNSIADMKGKRVGLPTVGNTAYFQTVAILNEYGIDIKDISGTQMQYSEQADALKDGTIDVAVVAGGIPVAAVTDLNTTKDIKLLTIDDSKVPSLLEKYPYWTIDALPGGTYSDVTEDTNIMIAQIVLICNSELDEEMVYKITKVLNENTADLANIHQNGRDWSLETTKPIFESQIVPFHPGAERYYKEVLGK